MPEADGLILEIDHLQKHFAVKTGSLTDLLLRRADWVRAVDDVSFDLAVGETVGVVGESGCGKTTLGRLVLGDLSPTAGEVRFRGQNLAEMDRAERRAYQHSIATVFQDPFSSLNPRHRVRTLVLEPIQIHGTLDADAARDRLREMLDVVGLPQAAANLYPHEFSGGQRQRIAIARALSLNPSLIVLDEPISALDVSIRAQIINLLKDIQQEFGPAYLFIAHDLASVYHMTDRVAVMYLGKVVEIGETVSVFRTPAHPYSGALIGAALPIDPRQRDAEEVLAGEVPSPIDPPSGCRFHPRCAWEIDRCRDEEPILEDFGDGRFVACHRAKEIGGTAIRPPIDLSQA